MKKDIKYELSKCSKKALLNTLINISNITDEELLICVRHEEFKIFNETLQYYNHKLFMIDPVYDYKIYKKINDISNRYSNKVKKLLGIPIDFL